MPRRRNASASQLKRPLASESEIVDPPQESSPKKFKEDDSEDGSDDVILTDNQSEFLVKHDASEGKAHHEQGVVFGTIEGEPELKGDNSDSDDNEGTESRERSLSTSSSSEQRNRSLEALFQVTDTELQAISKQAPEGHRIIQIDHEGKSETVYVIDPAIEDREELVGDPEVGQEEVTIDDSSEDTDDAAQPSTSADSGAGEDSHEYVDTPKWRQFKNIERILQKAGIDTSSKTWLTLTRPGRHICPYCQRACSKPSVLEKHIRAHTGERPYPCGVCGFSFKTKSNLYKHCKSRAHTLKTNVEAKKLRSQCSSEGGQNVIDFQTMDENIEFVASPVIEGDKKKEPAQRHVIQEVVKYLEKGKGQRPSEVQTERQRAKLERLKSVQDKWPSDRKKGEENRSIQRQLSLPVLPTSYSVKGLGPQFQKIAPKGAFLSDSFSGGEVKNIAQILVPGTYLMNEKGEILQPVTPVDTEHIRQPILSMEEVKTKEDDSVFYNQIEIVNLPDPDTDPETSTKALHDLEELSEKFSKAAKDGVRFSTAVQSLPDKRVQVVLQLQHPRKKTDSDKRVIEPSTPTTPGVSRGSISSSALKERIQRLISTNAAIIDTPKVDPPRAKCIRRNLSRQDSETVPSTRSESQTARSETETAVSCLLMPNIDSVPLQPLPQEAEAMFDAQQEVRETQRSSKKPNQKITVERLKYEGEDVLIINNDSDDENRSLENKVQLGQFLISQVSSAAESEQGKSLTESSKRILRTNLELPLTSTFLPLSTSGIIISQFNQSLSSTPIQSQPVICKGMLVSERPSSSSAVSTPTTKPVPGQLGKMALKNLQLRSKSLSQISTGNTPQTPVVSQSLVQVPGLLPQQFLVQTPGSSTVQLVQTPGKPLVQYAVQTPTQAPTQFAVHTPGQTPTQYTLQTPTTPIGQVLLPGSSTPVLLFGSGVPLQQEHQTIYIQQQQPQQNESAILVHTSGERQGQQFVGVIPSQPIILHPSVPGASSTPKILTGSVVSSSPSGSHFVSTVIQSPMLVPSLQTDPMRILSSIVSNTVNQQKLHNQSGTPTSQPKEIKIEIKIPPPPLQHFGTVQTSSGISQQKTKPVLKRQNSISSAHSPPMATAANPVFRFKNSVSSPQTPDRTTPGLTGMFRFQTAGPKSGQNTVTTSLTQKTPQTSIIKEYLLKGKEGNKEMLPSVSASKKLESSQLTRVLYKCPNCQISFKKKETLDLHILCYCKNKNTPVGEPAVQTGSQSSSKIQTDIVAKLFTQSKNEDQSLMSVGSLKSIAEVGEKVSKAKFSLPLTRSQSVIIAPDSRNKSYDQSPLFSQSGTPVLKKTIVYVEMTEHQKKQMALLNPKELLKLKAAKEAEIAKNKPKKLKELWQSKLKGQILKRKLKGKLLMNRSLSMDQSAINESGQKLQTPNKAGLKTRFVEENVYKDPVATKKPRLVRSYDDITSDGIVIKRPVFRRSKSVPEIPNNDKENLYVRVEKLAGGDSGQQTESVENADIKDWEIKSLKIPVVTADKVVQSQLMLPVKPIYQQNFRMKSFEGMGTPIQLVPSATLTPRPELMEIEKVRKMFTFESGSLKLAPGFKETDSPSKSPLLSPSMGIPGFPSTGDSSSKSPVKSPKVVCLPSPATPKKSPMLRQFSLVGHTYPSMRSMTHLSFCCVDRLQPNYVKSGKKISMYSNWRVAEQNSNPFGLPTRALLSLYNSRYTTNPVWQKNCGADLRSGAITHSSYWKVKHGESNVDSIFSVLEPSEMLVEQEQKQDTGYEVGYRTSEESVYVRGRGRGKYVCETCGIRCKKPSMLKKHIRSHTDLRPYKCKQCKFSFKTKGNLQKHMKSKSHYKHCLDLGITPVPTVIDESQIDEEALEAQCSLSKRARIYDKSSRSMESVEKDMSATDDNDDEEDVGDDDDDKGDDDGDDEADDYEPVDDGAETGLIMTVEQIKNKKTRTGEIRDGEKSQHHLFLQSLGIVAKSQTTHDPVNPGPSGTKPLLAVGNLGTSLPALSQLDACKASSAADTALQETASASSLSTVYGNYGIEKEEEAVVSKHIDVVWGLLNLSDQTQKSDDVENATKMETTSVSSDVRQPVQENLEAQDKKSPHVPILPATTLFNVKGKIPLSTGSFLPPYLSTASGFATSEKLVASKTGPIIGQIILNVTSPSKVNEKSENTKPAGSFCFQHPFAESPSVVLSTAVNPEKQDTGSEYATSVVPVNPVESSKNSSQNELQFVQIGNVKKQVETIQAQIVNIDPEVFKTSQYMSEIPSSNVLLKMVSEGLYVITTEAGTSGLTTLTSSPMKILTPLQHSADSVQATGSASHVIASGQLGRFVCSLCGANFPEYHQLILHGNVHFMENTRITCGTCSEKFRSHAAYEKHLHDGGCQMAVNVSDPRPHKCEPCSSAFRLKGHLTKHFRSRSHFKNLEALGQLDIGTWEKMEAKVSDIDANTVEEFLAKVQIILNLLQDVNKGQIQPKGRRLSQNQSLSEGQRSWSEREVMEEDEVFIENDGSEKVRVEVNELPYHIDHLVSPESEKYRACPLVEIPEESSIQQSVLQPNPQHITQQELPSSSGHHSQDQIVPVRAGGLADKQGTSVDSAAEKKQISEEASINPPDVNKVKPHKCGLCGQGFEMILDLKDHLISHAELRPYVCEYCDAGFTNAQSLKTHLLTHAQETPYVCGMCGLKFASTGELSIHSRLSHQTPPDHSHPIGISVTSHMTQNQPTSSFHASTIMCQPFSSSLASDVTQNQPVSSSGSLHTLKAQQMSESYVMTDSKSVSSSYVSVTTSQPQLEQSHPVHIRNQLPVIEDEGKTDMKQLNEEPISSSKTSHDVQNQPMQSLFTSEVSVLSLKTSKAGTDLIKDMNTVVSTGAEFSDGHSEYRAVKNSLNSSADPKLSVVNSENVTSDMISVTSSSYDLNYLGLNVSSSFAEEYRGSVISSSDTHQSNESNTDEITIYLTESSPQPDQSDEFLQTSDHSDSAVISMASQLSQSELMLQSSQSDDSGVLSQTSQSEYLLHLPDQDDTAVTISSSRPPSEIMEPEASAND